MRDLTGDELKLAPEWATHYLVDRGDIIYESSQLCWWVGLDEPVSNIKSFGLNENRKIKSGRFSLEGFEFSDDSIVEFNHFTDGSVELCLDSGFVVSLSKPDIVALSKDAGVTGDDLK